MVIIGAAFSLHRRLRNEGSAARQQFGNDLLPLLLLLAISVTGLLLTFSMHALGGAAYPVLSLIHAFTVSATLLYIPFGKFFHIFQRPLQIGVILHHRADATPATCRSCGEPFAGAKHVEDLKAVLAQSGIQDVSRLEICPRCKRRELGTVLSRGRASAEALHG
jgi:nitrate reductase gamma subunit